MNILFLGSGPFGLPTLERLAGRSDVALRVVTRPDRPSGRGLRLQPSALKTLALAHGLPVATPASLRKGDEAAAAHRWLADAAPDVLIVAAYGLILPQSVLDIPRGLRTGWTPKLTAINVHASLLPRWRGAAPIQRAIAAGDATSGVTIMQMDEGLDTGPTIGARALFSCFCYVAVSIVGHDCCCELCARIPSFLFPIIGTSCTISTPSRIRKQPMIARPVRV